MNTQTQTLTLTIVEVATRLGIGRTLAPQNPSNQASFQGLVPGVVLDTNVIISGTILERGSPYLILEAWRKGRCVWVTSDAQRSELMQTLRRPKFTRRYGLTEERIAAILHRLDRDALVVVPRLPVSIPVRDPDDEVILATALAGQAEVIVSGDRDLLALARSPELGSLSILTPAEFAATLSEG